MTAFQVSRFRLKSPPGISSSCISPLTSSGQRSRASWTSQPQKSATLSPQPGGKPRKFVRTCGGIGQKQKKNLSFYYMSIYRVIKKSLCTWRLKYRKLQVMFKVSPASLQTFIDTPKCVHEDRVQNSPVHILNVCCAGHLQIINCAGIVRVHWFRCTETFWSPCINNIMV